MAIRGKVLALSVFGLVLLAVVVAVAVKLQDRGGSPSSARSDPGGISAVLACDKLREGVPLLTRLIERRAEAGKRSFPPLPPQIPEEVLDAHEFAKSASEENAKYERLLDLVTAIAYGRDETVAVMNECRRLRV